MDISKYLEAIALGTLGLLPAQDPISDDKMIFVNDFEDVVRQRIAEYDAWYSGDSDALLNLYNVDAMIDFKTEPYYWKNKRSYFWATASQENEIKRTHSGFARDMVDTMVSICGTPIAKVGGGESHGIYSTLQCKPLDGHEPNECLRGILDGNDFWGLYRQRQMPLTLVEGWGAYKITWNKDIYGDDPVIHYYGAQNVRIYKRGNRVFGITFLDWYKDGLGRRYLIAETRVMMKGKGKFRTDVFKDLGDGQLAPVSKGEVPSIKIEEGWDNMPCLFAVPCAFYADTLHGYPGRSVYEGKVDALDDLDQALSQESNTVRRSTPVEQFDLDYCDRDKHGMPKMPKLFERRYVAVRGARTASGDTQALAPVTVTQPNLNTDLYDANINALECLIINGHLSPATMGIDISRKDNADAQREKEKITIFTRNHLIREEQRILKELFRQTLILKDYLCTGKVNKVDWDVSVEFDEFSNESYETKLGTLAQALANFAISPEMFVERVYGETISKEARDAEVKYISDKLSAQENPEKGGFGDMMEDGDSPFQEDEGEDADTEA